jgi:hypothetical protein
LNDVVWGDNNGKRGEIFKNKIEAGKRKGKMKVNWSNKPRKRQKWQKRSKRGGYLCV